MKAAQVKTCCSSLFKGPSLFLYFLLEETFSIFYICFHFFIRFKMMAMPNGICSISDMEHKISQLERGCVVTVFFARRKPQSKTLQIRRETRQILWSTARSAVSTSKIMFFIEPTLGICRVRCRFFFMNHFSFFS